MRHLIVCREYPPAPSGGIGTYAHTIAGLLAERPSETVHVIAQLWEGAESEVETRADGRLVIHRVPCQDWRKRPSFRPHPLMKDAEPRALFSSSLPAQAFSWQASVLAERLVAEEAIDVIEAEDYEAPLYFFLLRRALGLGPSRRPPCFIHLHSPTELIARHNDWDLGIPSVVTAKRLEEYCLAAADALLCPSRYLAHQAESTYGLPAGRVRVIPLPVANAPEVRRDQATWSGGSILFLGRLERRKGVLEWIDAAVRVAEDEPALTFDFVGANVLANARITGEEVLDRLIPGSLRSRFRFHGRQHPSALPRFLERARLAVVPSRWENFPYVCVEAMSSGIPVLATSAGGMAEMVEDGVSGWLTGSSDPDELEAALRSAIATPAPRIAEMGRRASVRIGQMCQRSRVADRHLEFRDEVRRGGAVRSGYLPPNLPWARISFGEERAQRSADRRATGLTVVVTASERGGGDALSSLRTQSLSPTDVVLARHGTTELDNQRRDDDGVLRWSTLTCDTRSASALRNRATQSMGDPELDPLGFVFMAENDCLDAQFLRRCGDVLERCPEVGLVCGWTGGGTPGTPPCPAFPYQWAANDVSGPFAVRATAFRGCGGFTNGLDHGYEVWDLANALMAAGWVAVTVPEILSSRVGDPPRLPAERADEEARARRLILERFPELLARDAVQVALLLHAHKPRLVRDALAVLSRELDGIARGRTSPRSVAARAGRRVARMLSPPVSRMLSRIRG